MSRKFGMTIRFATRGLVWSVVAATGLAVALGFLFPETHASEGLIAESTVQQATRKGRFSGPGIAIAIVAVGVVGLVLDVPDLLFNKAPRRTLSARKDELR